MGFNVGKNTRYVNAFIDLVHIDEDFNSDLGFIPRKDIFKMANIVQGNFWPKKGKINRFQAELFSVVTWRPSLDFLYSDYLFNGSVGANFKTLEEVGIGFQKRFVFLTSEFEPTGTEGAVALPANTGYHFNSISLAFESDERKLFNFRIESNYGDFFNGKSLSTASRFSLRFQPKVELGLNVRYDRIDLPQPYSDANIWLVSPRATITFSKSVFWSTLVQYSNQRDNLGVNSRLQWRFAPLSDLFIVYNDNYFVNTFMPRSRSINLKLTYWLNI